MYLIKACSAKRSSMARFVAASFSVQWLNIEMLLHWETTESGEAASGETAAEDTASEDTDSEELSL